jgi:hypothetical protein
MSASNPPKRSRRRLLFLFIPLLLAILCVLIGIWLFLGKPVSARDLGPSVYITTPVTGAIYEVGSPVRVTASGSDLRGMTRLELYVGGVLTAVQESPIASGTNPLDGFDTSWIPPSVGRYLLTVRGYRSDGRFADSSVVLVDVVARADRVTGPLGALLPAPADAPCPSLNQVATALGISLEDLFVLNPGLRTMNPDLSTDCGMVITLPRPTTPPPGMSRSSDFGAGTPPSGGEAGSGSTPGSGSPGITVTPAPVTGPAPLPGITPSPVTGPAPLPGITPTPVTGPPPIPDSPVIPTWDTVDPSACTSVNLVWLDTPDEEGYTLYRRAPGDSHLYAIATLPANQVTYTDSLPIAGQYYYQVAAVRAGVEALSSIQGFITPAECASRLPAPPTPPDTFLYLILPTLQTDTAYEGVYCYISMDGGAQGRLPVADWSALSPMSDGLTYDMRIPPNRGIYLLTRVGTDPVTLEMQCLGRRSVFSDVLGQFSASHPASDWDGRELTSRGSGFTAHYCITSDPTRTDCGAGMLDVPVVNIPERPPLFAPGISIPYVPGLPFVPIIQAIDLPAPTNLRIENGFTACDEYLTPAEQWSCFVTAVSGGGVPQLYWDWTSARPFTESTLTGYHVVATMNGAPWRDYEVHPGSRKTTLANTTDLPCGTIVTFQVTAFQGDMQSAPSETFTYTAAACPVPPPDVVTRARVHVIFNNITLSPSSLNGRINDAGDLCIGCPSNEFELSGTVYAVEVGDDGRAVWSRSVPQTLRWGTQIYGSGWGTALGGTPPIHLFAPGVYNYADIPMTGSSSHTGLLGNNEIVFDLTSANPTLSIGAWFSELDGIWTDNPTANIHWQTPARSIAEWATVNETYTRTGVSLNRDWLSTLFLADDLDISVSVTVIGEPLP